MNLLEKNMEQSRKANLWRKSHLDNETQPLIKKLDEFREIVQYNKYLISQGIRFIDRKIESFYAISVSDFYEIKIEKEIDNFGKLKKHGGKVIFGVGCLTSHIYLKDGDYDITLDDRLKQNFNSPVLVYHSDIFNNRFITHYSQDATALAIQLAGLVHEFRSSDRMIVDFDYARKNNLNRKTNNTSTVLISVVILICAAIWLMG